MKTPRQAGLDPVSVPGPFSPPASPSRAVSSFFKVWSYSALLVPCRSASTFTDERFALIHPCKPLPGLLSGRRTSAPGACPFVKQKACSWAESFSEGSFRRLERGAGRLRRSIESSVIEQCFSKWDPPGDGWGLRLCIYNRLPQSADAAGSRSTQRSKVVSRS